MNPDESAWQLHDKANRGAALSSEERAKLDGWYAAQDAAEAALFSRKRTEPAVVELRSQVTSALEQVSTLTRTIQQLTSENDALRHDLEVLRRQLAARPVSRPV